MNAEICMNILLSNSCQHDSEIEGYNDFVIELHCQTYRVTARIKDENSKDFNGQNYWEYDVLSIVRKSP